MLGYPRVFPTDTDEQRLEREQDCAAHVTRFPYAKFETEEQTYLNSGSDRLNRVIRTAVSDMRKAGDRRIYFDNISSKFTGHAHCDKNRLPEWINGITGHKFVVYPAGAPDRERPFTERRARRLPRSGQPRACLSPAPLEAVDTTTARRPCWSSRLRTRSSRRAGSSLLGVGGAAEPPAVGGVAG